MKYVSFSSAVFGPSSFFTFSSASRSSAGLIPLDEEGAGSLDCARDLSTRFLSLPGVHVNDSAGYDKGERKRTQFFPEIDVVSAFVVKVNGIGEQTTNDSDACNGEDASRSRSHSSCVRQNFPQLEFLQILALDYVS